MDLKKFGNFNYLMDRDGFKRSESGFDEQNESISIHFNPFSFIGNVRFSNKSSKNRSELFLFCLNISSFNYNSFVSSVI